MFVIGHRGLGKTFGSPPKNVPTENTLEAFEEAIRLGADGVEIDINLCEDGTLVCLHNPSLKGLENVRFSKKLQSRNIRFLSYSDLQTVRLPKGEMIPTLEDVFDLISHYKDKRILLDIKGRSMGDALASALPILINRSKLKSENLSLSSFDIKQVKVLEERLPHLTISPTFNSAVQSLPICLSSIPFVSHFIRAAMRSFITPYMENMDIYPDEGQGEKYVCFSKEKVKDILSVRGKKSIHLVFEDLTESTHRLLAEHEFSIFICPRREKHPSDDKRVLDFVKAHKGNENIYLITDYISEMLHARSKSTELKSSYENPSRQHRFPVTPFC